MARDLSERIYIVFVHLQAPKQCFSAPCNTSVYLPIVKYQILNENQTILQITQARIYNLQIHVVIASRQLNIDCRPLSGLNFLRGCAKNLKMAEGIWEMPTICQKEKEVMPYEGETIFILLHKYGIFGYTTGIEQLRDPQANSKQKPFSALFNLDYVAALRHINT